MDWTPRKEGPADRALFSRFDRNTLDRLNELVTLVELHNHVQELAVVLPDMSLFGPG